MNVEKKIDCVEVNGGKTLEGKVRIQGDKTVAVHILFAVLLIPKTRFAINNLPSCSDVNSILSWISTLGSTTFNVDQDHLYINSDAYPSCVDIRPINFIRSSICLLAPLALLNQKVLFKKIGGCNFTDRPIDRHLALAEALGISILELDDHYEAFRIQDKKELFFDCSVGGLLSVGVTCHALLSSLVFKGEMTLINVSVDPSVISVINLLRLKIDINFNLEARIIIIKPFHKREIENANVIVPFDLTVAITYISAALSTRGKLEILNDIHFSSSILSLLKKMNIQIRKKSNSYLFTTSHITNPMFIQCKPAPGIPTDCGPILTALLCNVPGTCTIQDLVYNFRNSHINPLKHMGYNVKYEVNTSITEGQLPNSDIITVKVPDIRAGAAILIAALNRQATTIITNFHEINRGYTFMMTTLESIGANIKAID